MTGRATQTRERPKTLLTKYPDRSHKFDSPLDKTKTLTMARSQATKRVTRKGSKQLTDEERESQVASLIRAQSPKIPPGNIDATIMRDPVTLTAAERKSQALFTPEMMQGVQDAQTKRAKITPEERAIDCEKTRLSMGMLPIAIVRQMK